eukprot:293932-Chlamydomonas_euryale.AAC.1
MGGEQTVCVCVSWRSSHYNDCNDCNDCHLAAEDVQVIASGKASVAATVTVLAVHAWAMTFPDLVVEGSAGHREHAHLCIAHALPHIAHTLVPTRGHTQAHIQARWPHLCGVQPPCRGEVYVQPRAGRRAFNQPRHRLARVARTHTAAAHATGLALAAWAAVSVRAHAWHARLWRNTVRGQLVAADLAAGGSTATGWEGGWEGTWDGGFSSAAESATVCCWLHAARPAGRAWGMSRIRQALNECASGRRSMNARLAGA